MATHLWRGGGARVHLVSRMNRDRYDVSVVSPSPGSAVRKLQRHDIPVTVIDEPDDAIATGILAAHLADIGPDIVHNHMYRAEIVGTKAVIAICEAGHRLEGHLDGPRLACPLGLRTRRRAAPDARDDDLIVASNAIDAKVAPGRGGPNTLSSPRYDTRGPLSLRPPGATPHAADEVRDGAALVDGGGRASGALEGVPSLSRRGPTRSAAGRGFVDLDLMIVGEGNSRYDVLHEIVQPADRRTGPRRPGAARRHRRR